MVSGRKEKDELGGVTSQAQAQLQMAGGEAAAFGSAHSQEATGMPAPQSGLLVSGRKRKGASISRLTAILPRELEQVQLARFEDESAAPGTVA